MPIQTYKSLRHAGASGAYLRPEVLVRLAIFLALTLPLVWVAVGFERTRLTATAQQRSEVDVTNLARAFAEEVNATISMVDLSLLHLRSHWGHDPRRFAATVERLNRELQGRVIMQVAVADARGLLVFSSTGTGFGMDMGAREPVRHQLDTRTDELFVSRPMVGRLSGVWTVQFSRPILAEDGRLEGVIVASVAPSYFSRFYSNIDLGPGTSVALVRNDGTIIARATRTAGISGMGKVLVGYPYQARTQPSSGHFRREGQLDGIERLYAWRDLPSYPLMVTVGQAVEDANARYARQKLNLTRAGIAASVLLALLGWVALAASDNRKRAAEALARAEARWQLALNAAGEGVWDCNFESGVMTLSPRAQEILDIEGPPAPLAIDAFRARVHPDDLPRVSRALQEHLDARRRDYVAEHRVRLRDGQWRWILVRGMLAERAKDGKALRMVGTFANIDARKSEEEQIRYQAHHDALTGLPNRLLFADRLAQAIRAAQRERSKLAVLYFDLDKFKPVNDTWGHAVGDGLLVEVARRVRTCLRESDTLARLGGDEFVVLLPGCADAADARKVGANILAQLNREFTVEGHALHISGSIGYALFPDDGRDDEELLRSADVAMYAAKSNGRGQVHGPAGHAPAIAVG
jgi:diguanylate cyclase (GGDEF)-like protein